MPVNSSEPPKKRRGDGRSPRGKPDTSIAGRSSGTVKSQSTRGTGGRAAEVEAIAKDLNSDLDTIRSKIDAIAVRAAEKPTDPFGAVGENLR